MITIGRLDHIDLPKLELTNLRAKIDTGAYGSALHCHHIALVEEDGRHILTFDVLDPDHPEYEEHIFRFEEFGDKVVKNTGGEPEHRYTIKTEVIIFNQSFQVEFSLTDRSQMKVPVLLGRKFLRGRFLVDVTQKDISYKLKKKQK
jgi:hypothetical protein